MSRFETTCPACGRSFKNSHVEMRTFCSVGCQVDDGERKFWDGKSVNHHPGCSVHDDGHCTCGYRAEREILERSPLAPGEGTWSVFAQKVVRERDEAREQVALLRKALKAYYHECLCQRPGMDEVNKLAYRALQETEPKE